MATVKLQTCYGWTCPCGNRNYGEGVPVELTQEDRAEIEEREEVDLSDVMQTGDLVCMPEEVTCAKCGAEHEAFDPREDGEDWKLTKE
jgi:hypothetical protein